MEDRLSTRVPYENRIVAFIDILGFKDLLSKTVKGDQDVTEEIEKIISAYDSVSDVFEQYKTGKGLYNGDDPIVPLSKMVTTFSDCIVISFLLDERSELAYTISELQWVQMRLISRGILSRGSIAYGKLIHTDNYLFGPALVEAYVGESKAALYPRIIVSEEIISLASKYHGDQHGPDEEIENIKSSLMIDSDGMYYIDYFNNAFIDIDDEASIPTYIEKITSIAREGCKHSKIDIRIKYSWLKDKINRLISQCKSSEFISNLNQNGKGDFADRYLGLKEA